MSRQIGLRGHRLLALAAAGMLAVGLTACGSDDNGDTSSTPTNAPVARNNVDGVLKFGLLMPQSGDLSAIIKSLNTPIEMAIKEINAAGGVNGKDVTSTQRDDGGGSDTAVASASLDSLLSSDQVDVILGPASSTTTLGIIDKIETNGVAECTGSNTTPELSVAGGAAGGHYFRTAPPDTLQGQALAQVVLGDNKSNIAILTRNDSYGTGFGKALQAALEDGGATVVENAAYDPKASDYKADVAKVADKNADAIVVLGFNDDGGKVIKEMIAQNVGPKDVQVYTADGMQGSSFYKGIDPSNPAVIEGIKGTAPAAAPGGVDSPFTAEYAKTGLDTIFSGYYYDCTIVTALAAQAAGSDDPEKIVEKVIEVTSGGEVCKTYKACLDLLKAGKDIDYSGASGPVDFTDNHEPSNGVYDVWAYDAKGAPGNVKGAEQISIQG
jgi:ABC-type branched-subunit amino acid transport system substrate-binding protein